MKRILFLSAIVIAMLMASCSSDGYKSYIPGDSKIIGKIDLKQFFAQTGVNQEKLMNDLASELGDDANAIKDTGIDFSEPIYIFGSGKGTTINFGVIAKVEDQEKFKTWFEKQSKETLSSESGFLCNIDKEAGLAVNDDVVVIYSSTERDGTTIKSGLSKIMNKEGDQKIDDNPLFNKVEGLASFANLYIDMSIAPAEAASTLPIAGIKLDKVRKMILGIDAEAKDGICDLLMNVKSDDKAVQEDIDKSMSAFGKISDKALDIFSGNDLGGVVLNTDGSKIIELIKEALGDNDDMKQALEMFNGILGKIKGNVLAKFDASGQYFVAAEGQNTTGEINSLVSNMGDAPFDYGYSTGYMLFGPKGANLTDAMKPASEKMPSTLTDLMKNRRQVIFVNVEKANNIQAQMSGSDNSSKAFSEVLDKIKYVTFSMK